MNATQPTDLERVITEFARGRCFGGLEELAEALGGGYTSAELADWPRPGFGHDLDTVLGLSDDERGKLVAAVVERIHRA
jgi:hypothetical protein